MATGRPSPAPRIVTILVTNPPRSRGSPARRGADPVTRLPAKRSRARGAGEREEVRDVEGSQDRPPVPRGELPQRKAPGPRQRLRSRRRGRKSGPLPGSGDRQAPSGRPQVGVNGARGGAEGLKRFLQGAGRALKDRFPGARTVVRTEPPLDQAGEAPGECGRAPSDPAGGSMDRRGTVRATVRRAGGRWRGRVRGG